MSKATPTLTTSRRGLLVAGFFATLLIFAEI